MKPGPIAIPCAECGAEIECPAELRRVPVSPVGELRYTLHVDPTPYYDHLDGRDTPPTRLLDSRSDPSR